MADSHRKVLDRIAGCNTVPSLGPGFDPHGLVPAFRINSRLVADALERRLVEAEIVVTSQKGRLFTQFEVAADQLAQALEIRDRHLSEHPDIAQRKLSHDYDSLFLISPIVIAVAVAAYYIPGFPRFAWLAILATGASAIALCERINRQYRVSVGWQWQMRELFIGTAIAAANIALWSFVL